MTIRFVLDEIAERTSGELTTTSDGSTVTFLDKDGNAVPSANMDSITMTLIEQNGGSTVNSRSAQNVLNANDCTYHATSGLFTWDVQPADTAIANTSLPVGGLEYHIATITFVWDTTEELSIEVVFPIRNLNKVPQS